MEHTKDYSLLRPFDLEAAKRGEAITDSCGGNVVYIDGPDAGGNYAVRIDGHFAVGSNERLRMAPLCWVEGRPVYKGDVLYMTTGIDAGKPFVPHQFNGGRLISTLNDTAKHYYRPEYLTWIPPKVKREGFAVIRINLHTREEAEAFLKQFIGMNPIADVMQGEPRVVHIEWEEPAC